MSNSALSPGHRATRSPGHHFSVGAVKVPTIIFAGGGSGGHISPGLAVAERLGELAPHTQSVFVCSQRAIDASMLREAGVEFVPVPASPPSFTPLGAARFVRNFYQSKRLVMRLIEERRVGRLVSMGGFVAAPAVSAAKACGVAVTLVNLDSPPGRANLWMAKRSDEVVSAIALPSMPDFACRVVGMPIRRRALAPAGPAECRQRLGLEAGKPTLLVTGASQGATSLNGFMVAFARSQPETFADWQVLHLAGQGADEEVRKGYSAAGIQAKVEPFLAEMGLAWGAADLAVSRAGASSVAEAARNAVPTLFLPYPYHKDMHQAHNAQPLVDLGAAVMAVDRIDPGENLRQAGPPLGELMRDDARREQMRQRLRAHEFPDAALTIASGLSKAASR